MPAGTMTPYSTVLPLIGSKTELSATLPSWVPKDEQERIASYQLYEQIYWGVPDTFKLVARGDENKPIYIPNPRTIVDTTAHYLLKGLTIGLANPEANPEAKLALEDFMRRERFYSKVQIAKHSGVTRGDWVLHLTADPAAPAGRRLSLVSVDPAMYFPIPDDDDLDKVVGAHLVDQFVDPADGKTYVKKLTYRYLEQSSPGAPRVVTREEAVYELDKWFKGDATPVRVLLPLANLPAPIDTIPVYHFQNIGWQGQPFGSSELRGFERIFSAVNQSISDEELALALDGLGVYATDSGSPVDEDNKEADWILGAAKVLELTPGAKFERVNGVGSITPMQDHLEYLENKLFEAAGTFRPNAIDVSTAESGVALAIKFSPMLAKVEERDQNGLDVLDNLFFDWTRWHRAYEGQDFTTVKIEPALGDKLPFDRKAKFEELCKMLELKAISIAFFLAELEKLGYNFPEDMVDQIVADTAKMTDAQDLAGNRIAQEIASGTSSDVPDAVTSSAQDRTEGNLV